MHEMTSREPAAKSRPLALLPQAIFFLALVAAFIVGMLTSGDAAQPWTPNSGSETVSEGRAEAGPGPGEAIPIRGLMLEMPTL